MAEFAIVHTATRIFFGVTSDALLTVAPYQSLIDLQGKRPTGFTQDGYEYGMGQKLGPDNKTAQSASKSEIDQKDLDVNPNKIHEDTKYPLLVNACDAVISDTLVTLSIKNFVSAIKDYLTTPDK